MGKCKGKKKGIAALVALFVMLPAIVLAGSAKLTWQDNSNNETVFNIERKSAVCASPLPWAEIATVTANVASYTDVGLAEGSVVCYRVAASNSAGKSGYTNEVAFTVPFTIPVAPSLLGVTILP
jgi:hypothetical protein